MTKKPEPTSAPTDMLDDRVLQLATNAAACRQPPPKGQLRTDLVKPLCAGLVEWVNREYVPRAQMTRLPVQLWPDGVYEIDHARAVTNATEVDPGAVVAALEEAWGVVGTMRELFRTVPADEQAGVLKALVAELDGREEPLSPPLTPRNGKNR